jgi:hypothetical protein
MRIATQVRCSSVGMSAARDALLHAQGFFVTVAGIV